MKKMWVLIGKDIRDGLTEKTSLQMICVPVVFTLVFKYLVFSIENVTILYILWICTFFNVALLPMCVFPLLVTQEKEKHTLPILCRSGVSVREILLSKAAATLCIELLSAALMGIICDLEVRRLVFYLAVNIVVSVVLLPFGGIVGIFAVDKNSTNVYSTFGVLFMMINPLFTIGAGMWSKLGKILPSSLLSEVFFPWIFEGRFSAGQLMMYIGAAAVWMAAGGLTFCVLYKKFGLRTEKKG